MKKRFVFSILAAFGILFLILDSKTAISGAQDGIHMCLSSVVPSIFPFLVLSGFLTSALCGANYPFLRPLSRLLGIPKGSEGIFLSGILGGYPIGAQEVHAAWKNGQLDATQANRMLSFCSNAGPAFLFGILSTQFPERWMLWLLWGIQILSAILISLVLPGRSRTSNIQRQIKPISFIYALKRGVSTMGYVCGWIILFRVVIAFLDRWVLWLLPDAIQVVICGILELANGCCSLSLIDSIGLRFVVSSGVLAFGGICVLMQTASIIDGLDSRWYVIGKSLQLMISAWLAVLTQNLIFPQEYKVQFSSILTLMIAIMFIIVFLVLRKQKKRVAFCLPMLYNHGRIRRKGHEYAIPQED